MRHPITKKTLFLTLLSILLAGCTEPKNNSSTDSIPARVVAMTVPGTPWNEEWQHVRRQVEQQPGSRFDFRFYINGQLGSEESVLSQLRRGRVQLGGFSLQGAASAVPELELLMTPYLFSSSAEVDYITDHYLTQKFQSLFAAKGLVLLNWAEVGWTHFYGRTPILSPEQAQGKKLRSSNALTSQLFIQAIGGDMVPLPFADIIPSLQTGLIEGGASGSVFYAISGVPKEAPHLTLTAHAFDTGVVLANKAWFDQLPDDQRTLLLQNLMPPAQSRNAVRAAANRILDNPQTYGIQLHRLDDQQIQLWRDAADKGRQQMIDRLGGEAALIDRLITEGKQAFAAQAQTPAS